MGYGSEGSDIADKETVEAFDQEAMDDVVGAVLADGSASPAADEAGDGEAGGDEAFELGSHSFDLGRLEA